MRFSRIREIPKEEIDSIPFTWPEARAPLCAEQEHLWLWGTYKMLDQDTAIIMPNCQRCGLIIERRVSRPCPPEE